MALVTIRAAELAFGLHPLLDRADFAIDANERVGLIGRNGTGKSSLLLAIAGQLALDDGVIGGVILERAAPVDIPTVTARLLSDRLRLARHKRISTFTTSEEMRIFSADGRPVALQVDGDYIGDTVEAVFGVWPGALTVIA